MSITDELREWLKSLYTPNSATVKDEGERIADRIDAEHEKALSQAYMDVSDSEWVRLPKDADGETWNVGDRDEDGNEVIVLKLVPDGWYVITVGNWPYRPESKRHYHAPTVEDVLREFANAILNQKACYREQNIADYAKRLTLAEGEDA